MSSKNIILSIVVFVFFVGMIIHPFRKTQQPHIEFLNKIEVIESYCDEARAISLSMPLLNDNIVSVYADSLLSTLVHLNYDWIIFVRTQDGFEKYIDDIEELNKTLDSLRMYYVVERDKRKNIRRMEEIKKGWGGNLKSVGYEI